MAVPAQSRRRLMLLVAGAVAVLALAVFASLARAEEARTLDEVEIEGEVRLPQVLFITSREAERPLDWLEAWDTASAADIASGAWIAPRIHLIVPATPSGTETETESTEPDEIPSATEEDTR
jgi:hypothetical protein